MNFGHFVCLAAAFLGVVQSNGLVRRKRGWIPGLACPLSNQWFKEKEDIKFVLHNKKVPGVDISDDFSKLLPNTPIKILIHGFLNNASSPMPSLIKDAYMGRAENYNVIIVDWSKGAGQDLIDYYLCHIPSRVVPLVANGVFDFLLNLIENQKINILYVNLIGHSLGAHIAARVGKKFIELGYKLPVIVGLDPARPDIPYESENQRLTARDAEYVEVIHTNSQNLATFRPLGTADFYPNFKRDEIGEQPGCNFDATCSHARSYQYFAESVEREFAFEAVRCQDLEALKKGECGKNYDGRRFFMGGPDLSLLHGKEAGVFYLTTNDRPPYGKNY